MLRCEQVGMCYGQFMLGPIDVQVLAGRVTALVGPNASGKTTMLSVLGGMRQPTHGCVVLGDRAVDTLTHRQRAADLVSLTQRPSAGGGMLVRELVALGRLLRQSDDAAVDAAIDSMELGPLECVPMGQLSVGQSQRAHLARVLAQASPQAVLVLDEPTAPLDPTWARKTWTALHAHARGGGAVVLAVHDVAIAADQADDAWVLNAGAMVAAGPALEVLSPGPLEHVFGHSFEWANRSDGSRWLVPSPQQRTS